MKVFICYRRKDSHYITDHIYEWIEREFGGANVFKDVDTIPLGRDFRRILQEAVTGCDVLLAVIGPRWLGETDAAGRRRADDPEDWVRIEIETALERDIPVIPLLVDGASFPREEDLPRSLRGLVYRHGMPIRPDPDFRHDMGRLIKALRGETASRHPRTDRHPRVMGLMIAVLSLIIFLMTMFLLIRSSAPVSERGRPDTLDPPAYVPAPAPPTPPAREAPPPQRAYVPAPAPPTPPNPQTIGDKLLGP